MKPFLALLIATLVLAACGVGGDPVSPAKAGVTVEGDVQIGVVSGG